MSEILGYGEDSLTLWALKDHVSDILKPFQDQTLPSNCLVFYRPSFGRAGGKKTAEFGEFDAVIASLTNIYLIESKWDNLALGKKKERTMRRVQVLRHHIFSWYITHWNRTYCNNWELFAAEQEDNFTKTFRKPIARSGTLLAKNLEFVLSKLLEHCKGLSSEQNIKNVLVFFYNKKMTRLPIKVTKGFIPVKIDYSQNLVGNFVHLT